MSTRIGINGFGRMGRLGMRAGWDRPELAFTRVNEIATDAAGSAHLLKFDSVHGVWDRETGADTGGMLVDGEAMGYSSNTSIEATDWSGCDIVIEATGRHHKQPESLKAYFDQGVRKVIVAAPVNGALNVVYGVNHEGLTAGHRVVSNASCTTNCLAPVAKVLQDTVGIEHGFMTTVHAYTNQDRLADVPSDDMRRGRAAAECPAWSCMPTKRPRKRCPGNSPPGVTRRRVPRCRYRPHRFAVRGTAARPKTMRTRSKRFAAVLCRVTFGPSVL